MAHNPQPCSQPSGPIVYSQPHSISPCAHVSRYDTLLQASGVTWKKLAPYNFKCRRVVTVRSPRSTNMSGGGWQRFAEACLPSPSTSGLMRNQATLLGLTAVT